MPLLLGNKMICSEKSACCLIVFLPGFKNNYSPETKFCMALFLPMAGDEVIKSV